MILLPVVAELSLEEVFAAISHALEAGAVLLLLLGLFMAFVQFVRTLGRTPWPAPYWRLRIAIGRTLLLALEFLIAADVVFTIAVEPTFASLGRLGLLVLIRTFLSFSLEAEIGGRWPWQGKGMEEEAAEIEGTPAP